MPTKVALVTGANRGIGLASARLLAESGMTVLLGSRHLDQGLAAVDELQRDGLDVEAIELDVDDDGSVEAAADRVASTHEHLDVLVNNAGILPEATATHAASPVDVSLFLRTFDTNVFGVVRMLQRFSGLVGRSRAGRIVNVSTTMGSLSEQQNPDSPYFGLVLPAYQASKAALNSITIAMSKVLPAPVKVTSVCPGWVQTDLGGEENRAMAPLSAEEAARVVVTAASLPDDAPSGQFFDSGGAVSW